MARIIPPTPVMTFIPKSLDNDADPTPVTIHMRQPTSAEFERLCLEIARYVIHVDKTGRHSPPTPRGYEIECTDHLDRRDRWLRTLIVWVENYSDPIGPIEDGASFIARGERSFLNEAWGFVLATALESPEAQRSAVTAAEDFEIFSRRSGRGKH